MSRDVELIKQQIVAQLDDYEREIAEFAAFMELHRPKPRLFSEEAGLTFSEAAE